MDPALQEDISCRAGSGQKWGPKRDPILVQIRPNEALNGYKKGYEKGSKKGQKGS